MRILARKILWKFYKPKKDIEINQPVFYQLKNLPKNRTKRIIHGILKRDYEQKSNERTVEIPFVFQNLKLKKGSKIMDFGCTDSKLSIELASLGYKVTGTDLRNYELKHPNFTFTKGDFQNNQFKDESFDAIIAISAIEHCGLADYNEKRFEQGDYKIIKELHRILKLKGRLILTVPFGKKGVTKGYRIYDHESICTLLKDFKIKKEEFFVGLKQKYWMPTTYKELEEVDSIPVGFTQGVACILAEK